MLTRPMQLSVCGTSSINLSPGISNLVAEPTNVPFSISSIALYPKGTFNAFPGPTPVSPNRTLAVESWGADSRSVSIGAGAQSYFEIHENFNPGWKATLNGMPLQSVTLDGWQQGFVVPSGQGGVISLTYVPNYLYRLGIVAGALAALALVIAAILALLGRLDQGKNHERVFGRPDPPRVIWLLGISVVLFLVGGPMVLAVPLLALLARRYVNSDILPRISFVTMVLAGIGAAVDLGLNAASGLGSFGFISQGLALIALAGALLPQRSQLNKDEDNKLVLGKISNESST
ncbi:MAG: hypothetical protein HKL80_07875 [Acidimicrobiales bacterium]|nr:hypothetical protein [Acidimicrobiales bacterium]